MKKILSILLCMMCAFMHAAHPGHTTDLDSVLLEEKPQTKTVYAVYERKQCREYFYVPVSVGDEVGIVLSGEGSLRGFSLKDGGDLYSPVYVEDRSRVVVPAPQ